MTGKKVLVLGGTGAMGVYLVPQLATMGYDVTVVSLDDVVSDNPRIHYVKANAKDVNYQRELLKEHYDGIIDFLIYSTAEFQERHEVLLRNTDHYFLLSSYRIYDGHSVPITEECPRLVDASQDTEFLATDDYSLSKARAENIVVNSGYKNWTIVRPAITYSKRRFQLVTLEAPIVVGRTMRGLPVIIPEAALKVQATMSWAGDVANLFAHLLFNPAALCERFTLATAEHRPWGEVAEYYKDIIGLNYIPVSTEDYLQILGGGKGAYYQLAYDRLFERIVDNSKVLRVTGLKQENFTSLRDGLEKELRALPKDFSWGAPNATSANMDKYIQQKGL
ncbi:MAG: NAD-dependent epimerase/dehydratase family protein [Lentisphaeria bacterium]|nr:NAD-dependent epimerase/dehydratase family protein [Lentisphaeria bacterium]